MIRRLLARAFPLLPFVCAVFFVPLPVAAQPAVAPAAEAGQLRLDVRFVDRATGMEAEWGATGQILLQPEPADQGAVHWQGARAVATSPSRQSVTLVPGGRAAIRVGREIPFAGWFLHRGRRNGLLDERTEWREVESAIEIEALPPSGDGMVRLVAVPEFGYQQGRSRRCVAFPDARAEIVLAPGVETRFAPPPGEEDFFSHLFAGYDLLRRVRTVDLLLRLTPVPTPVP